MGSMSMPRPARRGIGGLLDLPISTRLRVLVKSRRT
jgi:hypothetical protein